jgi:PAS domain S-box-containing protein
MPAQLLERILIGEIWFDIQEPIRGSIMLPEFNIQDEFIRKTRASIFGLIKSNGHITVVKFIFNQANNKGDCLIPILYQSELTYNLERYVESFFLDFDKQAIACDIHGQILAGNFVNDDSGSLTQQFEAFFSNKNDLMHSILHSLNSTSPQRKLNGVNNDFLFFPEFIDFSNEVFFILLKKQITPVLLPNVTHNVGELDKKGIDFRLLTNHLNDCIIVFDTERNIKYVNAACIKLLQSFEIRQDDFHCYNSIDSLPKVIADQLRQLFDLSSKNQQDKITINNWIECVSPDERRYLLFNYVRFGVNFSDEQAVVIQDHTEIQIAALKETQSKEFYECILNEMPADIAVFDANHRYLYVNQLGIKDSSLRKWIIGKNDHEYCDYRNLNHSIADERSALFSEVLINKEVKSFIDSISKDGKTEYVFRKFYPIVKNGAVQFVVGYGTNVTDLQNAHLQLSIQEARFKQLFEHNPAFILLLNSELEILDVNAAFSDLLEITKSNFKQRSLVYFFDSLNYDTILYQIDAIKRGEEANSFLCEIDTPKGKVYVEMVVKLVTGDNVNNWLIVGINITDRREIELQFINSQNQINLLLETFSTVTYEAKGDSWYDFIFIHENILKLLGFSSSDFLTNRISWSSLIHPEDKYNVLNKINSLPQEGFVRVEYRIQDSEGKYVWLRDSMRLSNSNGEIRYFISGLIEDISNHVSIQNENVQLQRCQNKILKLVNEEYTDISQICSAIVKLVKDEIDFKSVQIWDYIPNKKEFTLFSDSNGEEPKLSSSFAAENLISEERKNSLYLIINQQFDVLPKNSLIGLIRRDGLLKGFVCLMKADPEHTWTFPHIQFVQSIADQVSLIAESYFRRVSQFKLETALEYGNIMIAEFNLANKSILWSASGEVFFKSKNWPAIPIYSKDLVELIHPDDKEFFKRSFAQLIQKGKPLDETFRLIDMKGELYFIQFKVRFSSEYPLQNNLLIGVLQDVTSKVRASQELKISEEGNHMANELDASLRLLKSEREVRELFSDLVTRNLSIADSFFANRENSGAFVKMDKWQVFKGLQSEIASGFLLSTADLLNRAWLDGVIVQENLQSEYEGVRNTQFMVIPINFNEVTECLFIAYCNAHDSSSDARATLMMRFIELFKQRILEIRREFELLKLNADLKLSNEQMQQYSYIVSHNLRAPISNLLGMLNLFDQDGIKGERNQLLYNKFSEATISLDQIIKDMSDLLHLKDSIQFKFSQVLISEVFDLAHKSIVSKLTSIDAELTVDFSSESPVLAYKPYMLSIMQNLLSNAIKFRDKNKTLKIEVVVSAESNDIQCFRFKDNGIGIDLERNRDKIFKIYSRFQRDLSGSGIGLYLVNEQIKAQQGRIEIQSQLGLGTEFKLFFNIKKK